MGHTILLLYLKTYWIHHREKTACTEQRSSEPRLAEVMTPKRVIWHQHRSPTKQLPTPVICSAAEGKKPQGDPCKPAENSENVTYLKNL